MSKAALLDAIRRLDLGAARQLIAAKPDLVCATHRDGRNLLHLACSHSPHELGVPPARQVRLVEWLLGLGFAIDEPFGRDACPALFFAVARARNPRLAAFLLAQGASLEATPGHCLFAAAWWNDVKSLRLLLDSGASIDNVHGITPFLSAWCWKRFDAAMYLVLRGADVDFQDAKGRTALRHGIENEYDPALLRWLVRHGASPDVAARDGVTPRDRASRKRNKRFAAALGPERA